MNIRTKSSTSRYNVGIFAIASHEHYMYKVQRRYNCVLT